METFSNSNMEFAIPYARQDRPVKIVSRHFPSVKKHEHTSITTDDDITNRSSTTTEKIHSDSNQNNNKKIHKLQRQQQLHRKMTKKQLKLAQAQLDKLTQINIHLHGKYVFA